MSVTIVFLLSLSYIFKMRFNNEDFFFITNHSTDINLSQFDGIQYIVFVFFFSFVKERAVKLYFTCKRIEVMDIAADLVRIVFFNC